MSININMVMRPGVGAHSIWTLMLKKSVTVYARVNVMYVTLETPPSEIRINKHTEISAVFK